MPRTRNPRRESIQRALEETTRLPSRTAATRYNLRQTLRSQNPAAAPAATEEGETAARPRSPGRSTNPPANLRSESAGGDVSQDPPAREQSSASPPTSSSASLDDNPPGREARSPDERSLPSGRSSSSALPSSPQALVSSPEVNESEDSASDSSGNTSAGSSDVTISIPYDTLHGDDIEFDPSTQGAEEGEAVSDEHIHERMRLDEANDNRRQQQRFYRTSAVLRETCKRTMSAGTAQSRHARWWTTKEYVVRIIPTPDHETVTQTIVVVPSDLPHFHVFRYDEDDREQYDNATDILAEVFHGLLQQRFLLNTWGVLAALDEADESVINFGRILMHNFGKGRVWKKIWGKLENSHLLTQADLKAIYAGAPSENLAYDLRNFNDPEDNHVHCFGRAVFTPLRPRDRADDRAILQEGFARRDQSHIRHIGREYQAQADRLQSRTRSGTRAQHPSESWGWRNADEARSWGSSRTHDNSRGRGDYQRDSRPTSDRPPYRDERRPSSSTTSRRERDRSPPPTRDRSWRDRHHEESRGSHRSPARENSYTDAAPLEAAHEEDYGGPLQWDDTFVPAPPPAASTSSTAETSSGHAGHTLMTALDLPAHAEFATPGQRRWLELIKFMQQCLSRHEPLRAKDWPKRLRWSVNSTWDQLAPAEIKSAPGFNETSWMTTDVRILIPWMEAMHKKTSVVFSREDRINAFTQTINDHPLCVDVLNPRNTPQSHSLKDSYHHLYEAYQQIKDEGHGLTAGEEGEACRQAWKLLDFQGMQPTPFQSAQTEIKAKCATAGSSRIPTQFLPMLKAILDKTTAILLQIAAFNSDYAPRSEGPKGPKPPRDRETGNRGQADQKDSGNASSNPSSGTKTRKNKRSKSPTDKPSNPKKARADQPKCYGCGYSLNKDKKTGKLACNRVVAGHDAKGCRNDPRRSTESGVDFAKSAVGKQWLALGYHSIPKDPAVTLKNAKSKKDDRGMHLMQSSQTDILLQRELIPFSIPSQTNTASAKGRKRKEEAPPSGKLLLDTGAIGGSVMSTDYAKRMRKHDHCFTMQAAKHSIATAGNNKLTSNKKININIAIPSEKPSQKDEVINVEAAIAPTDVDLILDRDTIKAHNLVHRFPSHFAQGELLERLQAMPVLDTPILTGAVTGAPFTPKCDLNDPYSVIMHLKTINVNPSWVQWRDATTETSKTVARSFFLDEIVANTARQQALTQERPSWTTFLGSLTVDKPSKRKKGSKRPHKRKRWAKRPDPTQPCSELSEEHLNQIEEMFLASMRGTAEAQFSNFSDKSPYEREGAAGLDEIPEHKLESIPESLLSEVHADNEYTKVHVSGNPLLADRIRKLIRKFRSIFRGTVQGEPSTAFDPFRLEIDLSLWERPCNAGPVRATQAREKEIELDRMIDIMLTHDIVESCTDPYYSHAFLTPKPNGKWRFVLDFKPLNRATLNKYEWPIPNIKEMLTRVGDQRPEYFAVFDLTSGYYQAPIHEDSRKFTAFRTKRGIFRWKRLPMGLTHAGSYFQHQLSTKVLNGLLHDMCELYLDDCMVYAGDADEYIARLTRVFERFKEHGITLNPEKCHLGLTQVEYVGHTINKNGLHFTRDKLDSVLNFPRPETMKHVKSFLGLANYFRDHIRNHSLRVQALQDLVADYSKPQARTKVTWTEACEAAFIDIRQAIDDCPMLWFLDDHSPIFLQTDASDYGIGAYLYQKVLQEDGTTKDYPVGFISKSLVSGHDSWDIPMKEGFAIFYALRKWEYLLRGRRFTILTDHENLTRLRTERSANKMVTRWFTAYQDFDIIEWVHVPAEDNEVPDSFSRLCSSTCVDDSPEATTTFLFQLTGYEMAPEHWETIRLQGHGSESGHGHGGIKRTLEVLRQKGLNWPTMAKDVRKFVKMCPCCQKMNVMKPVIHSYPYTLSTYGLFNTVSVDLIEQLKPDDYGMSMIVVIIDNFSRFVDLYPIANTSAEAAADALIQFTGRFQTPVRFTTDSGSNFKSNLMDGLMTRLGADHQLTKAYSKEQNGLVERVNREVISHLKAIIFDRRVQNKWSRYLPIVQRYINTSVHSATGCTPAEVVFPNGAQIDRELLLDANGVVVSAYIREMQAAQGRIIEVAEEHLRQRDQAHMNSREGTEPEFAVGSYVLVEHRHNSLRCGPKSKLLPFKAGPYLVHRKGTEGMYTLRDLITMKPKNFHVSKLTEFRYDERTLQPIYVATTDMFDEFVVERVLEMRGRPRGPKRDIAFKVRWAGYQEADDTWISWKDGYKTTAVQSFLHAHADPSVRRLGMADFDPDAAEDEEVLQRDSDQDSD